MEKLYEVLGLPPKSSIEEVRKAYKRLVLIHHPDKPTGDRGKFEILTRAYNILSDEGTKLIYDASLDTTTNTNTYICVNKLFDLMQKMFTNIKREESNNYNRKKVDTIKVNIKLTLDEVYRGDIKKVIVRVRRGDTWVKEVFYVNLLEHKKIYKFENRGDEVYGEKGDVEIHVKVLEHPFVKIDNVLCEYDLYMEESMSLYELYYGFERELSYMNKEKLNIRIKPGANYRLDSLNYSYTHVVEGYGLPYINIKDNEIYYGNLYIYFKLKLPDVIDIHDNAKELIKNIFVI
jgi:DnaJ-class molecular chaperone